MAQYGIEFPSKWINFKGKLVYINEVDHQYLSNAYWYAKIFDMYENLNPLIHEFNTRFNGQILPYRPHIQFEYEINSLKEKGMLYKDLSNPYKQTIFFNGVCIGEILSYEKTN